MEWYSFAKVSSTIDSCGGAPMETFSFPGRKKMLPSPKLAVA